jgi:hypothetical protein
MPPIVVGFGASAHRRCRDHGNCMALHDDHRCSVGNEGAMRKDHPTPKLCSSAPVFQVGDTTATMRWSNGCGLVLSELVTESP